MSKSKEHFMEIYESGQSRLLELYEFHKAAYYRDLKTLINYSERDDTLYPLSEMNNMVKSLARTNGVVKLLEELIG